MVVHLKTAIKYIFLFLIGIAVLYFAFKNQDLCKIWLEIKSANYFWILLSVVTVWFAHVLRAMRWQMLYNSISYKVSFWNTYHAVFIGYLANLALPRFGEIAKCSVVHKTANVPLFASIGTVITERLFDIFVLLLTGLALVFFQFNLVFDFLNDTIYANISKQLAGINYLWVLGLLILLLVFVLLIFYLLRKKFNNKFLRILVSLKQGFNSYHKLKNKPLFLVYTFGIWVLYFLSMYFAFFSLAATASLGLNVAYTALVFSSFAMVAPVQGGIGVFHWMVAQALLLHFVPFKDGLAYATIIHSSQLLLVLFLGSASLFVVLTKRRSSN
ncbi:flippase-like domain-containing protein [Pedobacter changchengzhani]|uniref:Flippase-like domain-containing protein n=1 Tax=Pedobacter changchengzhani TaxID=2529274 RepID=A0A4R5MPP9_9SPHI|nr:lysylphosphatidylglycerol synthase transmembrane domain-containing protein [Pedobacter changchengzhani]TDG37159.1 flippase-like domain-containing protein [Pedobacter changchengzhani]